MQAPGSDHEGGQEASLMAGSAIYRTWKRVRFASTPPTGSSVS
jgi:hypothetical protein